MRGTKVLNVDRMKSGHKVDTEYVEQAVNQIRLRFVYSFWDTSSSKLQKVVYTGRQNACPTLLVRRDIIVVNQKAGGIEVLFIIDASISLPISKSRQYAPRKSALLTCAFLLHVC